MAVAASRSVQVARGLLTRRPTGSRMFPTLEQHVEAGVVPAIHYLLRVCIG